MDIRCRIAIALSSWFPEALRLHDTELIVEIGDIERAYYRCRRKMCRATHFVFA